MKQHAIKTVILTRLYTGLDKDMVPEDNEV